MRQELAMALCVHESPAKESMEKILVIEDDRATRKALQQLFEPEGYTVETAQDGAQGLAAFRTARPNFVILDLRMPMMGGQDVCRQIRKESEEVPILILTGSADEVDRVLLLELGADDYVTKPFSPKEVLARVRAVLRRARRSPAVEQVYFGDVSVDFSKMEVYRAGRAVSLTPQEFKVLKYFSQNPERVVSRDQLLSDVWGYNSYPSTRTVDSHILTLRQKLEKDPTHPVHFLTVHNAGYKFVP
jgi:two-component system, OmpR family, alkaline phosphatase synthesis response regulator PhoP